MGDLNECFWRTTIFFVAASKDHFTGLVVLVEKQASHMTPNAVVQDGFNENYSSVGFLVVLLVLFGVEHVLSCVRASCKSRTVVRLAPPTELTCNNKDEAFVRLETAAQQENNVSPTVSLGGKAPLPTCVDSSFQKLLDDLCVGIVNNPPQRADDGTSGVYFMRNSSGDRVAVFKPADEEGMHLADYAGGDVKPGCKLGEGPLKEVAAYLLDQQGFHGVPSTSLAKFASGVFKNSGAPLEKHGSVQEFVPFECTAEDMGPRKFTKRDVHKIGLLDCRILNQDRHLGNILVTEDDEGYHLVPIDHGLSLPSVISGGASFEWLQFPQSKEPFDEDTVNFVCNIDADRDVQMLRQQLPDLREECIETMKICTIFLKKAVSSGLTLYEIGCMMSRYLDERKPSALEMMYARVQQRTAQGASDFWRVVDEEIERALVGEKL